MPNDTFHNRQFLNGLVAKEEKMATMCCLACHDALAHQIARLTAETVTGKDIAKRSHKGNHVYLYLVTYKVVDGT